MVREATIRDVPSVLRMECEPEVDILTIHLQDPETPLSHSSEEDHGLILNYAEDGSLSSIEIMDASRRYPAGQLAAPSVDEFIDLRTASRLVAIAPVTLRAQAEKGRLWAIRLGGQWITTRERLKQYVDSRARTGEVKAEVMVETPHNLPRQGKRGGLLAGRGERTPAFFTYQ